ncbi:MAG: hypothetical protein HC889_15510 [Synechococcaceae cyanobacterium SM1_2_3]|nr:hypothetical protein [Synechococcaceae cyanobacterium SM1_2_3]
MRDYFTDAERVQKLRAAARRWLGTPFIPHARICQAGVDCVNLCAELYRATGFLGPVCLPGYSMDGGKHNPESQLEKWLEDSARFRLLAKDADLLPGDLITFKIGRSAHHAGMILDGPHFIHCLFGRTVTLGTLVDGTFRRILHHGFRPLEAAR